MAYQTGFRYGNDRKWIQILKLEIQVQINLITTEKQAQSSKLNKTNNRKKKKRKEKHRQFLIKWHCVLSQKPFRENLAKELA